MGKIKLSAILVVCFVLIGFATGGVHAQEIPPAWHLNGGVYHMISSPYMPEDRDPQVSLVDDLGFYEEIEWRFFRHGYDPDPDWEQSRYFELKMDWSNEHDLDHGKGYWVISRTTRTIGIEGETVSKDWIKLEHEGDGWNQIGNIFDYNFPIVNLYVARESNPLNRVQLIDDDPITGNTLTYLTLQEFENGDYVDIPTTGKNELEVGKGYWLRVQPGVGEDVILWFVVGGPSALSKEVYLSEEFFERVAQQEEPPDPPPSFTSSFSSGSSSGSVGCFIATVAYRDHDHPNVQILREFRDHFLLTNSFGRMFVDMYYRYSPSLSKFVANRSSMKTLARFTLMPIVGFSSLVIKMNVYGFLIVLAFPIVMGFFLLMESGGWGGGICKPKFSIKSEEGKGKE